MNTKPLRKLQEQFLLDTLGEGNHSLQVCTPGPPTFVTIEDHGSDDCGHVELEVVDPDAGDDLPLEYVVNHAEWLRGRRFSEWLRSEDIDKYRLFGEHTPEQYTAVKASAAQDGIQVATIRDEHGNLLDGFLRNDVADDLGIPCPTEIRQFNSEAEKYEFILTVNCQRRQLNQDQKRKLISAYLIHDPEINDNWLAEIIGGISKNTVADERRRLQENGQIGKFTKLRGKDGKTRPARFKKIIANTSKEVQKAIEVINDLPPNCAGKIVDLTTAKRRARRHQKKEERDNRIIAECRRVLKPGGALAWAMGCKFQRHFAAWFGGHRIWGFSRFFHRGINAFGHIWMVQTREQTPIAFPNDDALLILGHRPQITLLHPCAKTEEEMLFMVRHLTKPGQAILDCFCGTGTTLVAAERLERSWIGCDLSKRYCQIAMSRLAELQETAKGAAS